MDGLNIHLQKCVKGWVGTMDALDYFNFYWILNGLIVYCLCINYDPIQNPFNPPIYHRNLSHQNSISKTINITLIESLKLDSKNQEGGRISNFDISVIASIRRLFSI